MPFKYSPDGTIALQDVNGVKLPVFINADGKEAPFDADATVGTIGRLNAEAKTHREGKEAAEKLLKGFDGITDPAKALEAMRQVANFDEKQRIAAGEKDKAIAEAVKAVRDAEVTPAATKVQTLEQQLNNLLIGGAFSNSKYVATKFAAADSAAAAEIARALFKDRFKVEEGKLIGYDASGNKLYSRVKPGEIADSEEAIELMVEGYAHKASILKGSGAAGGGAGGSGGQGGGGKKTMTRAQFDALDQGAKAAVAKDHVITE